jgi:hypothetical protein
MQLKDELNCKFDSLVNFLILIQAIKFNKQHESFFEKHSISLFHDLKTKIFQFYGRLFWKEMKIEKNTLFDFKAEMEKKFYVSIYTYDVQVKIERKLEKFQKTKTHKYFTVIAKCILSILCNV